MKEENQKQWLFLDGVIRKIKQGRWWMTDLDPWKVHVDAALKELEAAKKILEEQ